MKIGFGCVFGVVLAASAMGSWTTGPVMTPPGGRIHCAPVMRSGVIYALGGMPWVGEDGTAHSLAPGAAIWSLAPSLDGMGSITGQGAGVDSLGRIVIFGGIDEGNDSTGSTKEYDPTEGPKGSLASRPSSAPATYFAWCTDADGRIYSIGGGKGREAVSEEPNVSLAWRYIATTNSWQSIASMPSGLGDACAAYDGNGHILVFGGVLANGGSRTSNVRQYDIASNTWSDTAIPNMPVAINGARAVLGANGWIYVIGGESGPLLEPTMLKTTWIFRPDQNAWSAGPDLATARRYHGAILGPDDNIYVIGGENANGGVSTTEKLYTPPVPTISTHPTDVTVWAGQSVLFRAVAVGGQPMTYQWYRDGTPLLDGQIGTTGTQASGTSSTDLLLTTVTTGAAGTYWCVATNPSGTSESLHASLQCKIPPRVSGNWKFTSLHPSWAEQSFGYGASNGVQVGNGVRDTGLYNNIDLACTWSGSAASCQTFMGPGSVGGAFYSVSNGLKVGYWWWPYQVYVGGHWATAYSRQACAVTAAGNFVNLQYSGWEYSSAACTDGGQIVGTASTDDESGNYYSMAMLWNPNTQGGYSPATLGSGYGDRSSGSVVYAGVQYGTWSLYGVQFNGYHPCQWTGNFSTRQDVVPAGTIAAAHFGQQGGSINNHATVWTGNGATLDIHPPNYVTSAIAGISNGVQVGSGQSGSYSHAGVWAGSAHSFVDLHGYLPNYYQSSSARGVDVEPNGTITVVGTAFNTILNRNEAVMWRLKTSVNFTVRETFGAD